MLSLKEACLALNVPYTSVLYHYHAGHIPVTHIAGRNLITPETLRLALTKLGYRRRRTRAPA